MKKWFLLCLLLVGFAADIQAQRKVDNLGRGLVAVKLADNGNTIGTLVSWRRLATEYYDVTYNLYYNGALLASGLTNTNYSHDHSITGNETYQVAAVVRGVEKEICDPVKVWSGWQMYKNGDRRFVGGYLNIPLGEVYSRHGVNVTDSYWPNDIEVADLDGDGEMEFIVKRMNMTDANNLYVDMSDPAYDVIEAYEFDGTRLWWIDVGANMVSLNSTETNVIAFDWDQDGAAEVVLRGADDMVIHYMENGVERTQNIGTYGLSTRNTVTHSANATFTNTGNEYLIYLNGATGKPYNIGDNPSQPWMNYPLPRLEQGETSEQTAWGTGLLGHRSSKYFMGAPYLDGRKPFLFLGRGIYTRHKMMALNLDPNSHKWYSRWSWTCSNSNSPWWGQGYHNYLIADVDEDGRDEIVYGSMVIDDNGSGLYTTGFGHGDAQHVGDFDPWRKGLEFFGCLEDYPYWGCNYRDATTGEILYKYTSPKTPYNPDTDRKSVKDENGNLITDRDDGRALMANFSNDYPGSQGRSANSDVMSTSTRALVGDLSGFLPAGNLNFRIYWDGDLLSEWQDSPGQTNDKVNINKPGLGRIFNADGTAVNNDTKHNTCFQGDIIGDWREEFIARVDSRTVRLYTTGVYSEFSLPSLWYDHQYRQAMATQQMVYNLPPHLSFFLGELEGYTQAPPPQITNERTEIENNGTITSSLDGRQVIACKTDNMTIHVEDGASPWVFTDNAPAWVQGSDYNGTTGTRSYDYSGALGIVESSKSGINHSSYTHTVTGGAFTGDMHLTKQGDGTLVLPDVTETYTGNTTVWAGTLQFNGTMESSPVSMKRLTTLNTTGGTFNAGISMQYGATLNIGGPTANTFSNINVSELTLEYGACVVLDVMGKGENEHDWLNATTLNIDDSKVGIDAWENYGPEDIVPVFKLNMTTTLDNDRYPIGNVTTVNGDLSRVKIECDVINPSYLSLIHDDGILYLQVSDVIIANEATIEITGMAPYEDVSTPYPSASSENYYLPVVSIVANNTNGQTPTLTGTFTALDGEVTNLGSTAQTLLYSQDYESETDASSWTNGDGVLELVTGDNSHGKYIHHNTRTTNNRSAYTLFNCNLTDQSKYVLEFDAAIQVGNVENRSTTDFVVMTQGAVIPTTKNIGFDYNGSGCNNSGAGYLLRLQAAQSQEFTINESTSTVSLSASTWYHYKIVVDTLQRKADYSITSGSNVLASGTFTIPDGTSYYPQGIFILDGRGAGDSKFDNISIKQAGDDLSSFTFPEPGTLQVTSAVEGYSSGIKTFEVKYPYYKLYGKDFDQITNANIAEVLGSNWNTTAQNTRWAFWSKNNSIYGENYQAYWVVNNTSPIYLCNDSDPKVVWMDSNSSYKAAVMESFGVGRNSGDAGATIHVQNCGDSNTLIYYLVDNSQGNSPSTYGGFDKADNNGGYTIAMTANYTLAKLYIYVPVSIHDELAANLPMETTDGNAHLYRNGLATTSSWASMVVPFDMTASQVKETFGDDVVIGNLNPYINEPDKVYFETETGAVKANVPFLIKGVTKTPPYLIMGITSSPVDIPMLSTPNFDYIGTFLNMGLTHHFTTSDYFFMANSDKLKQVASDSTKMTVKGYRAWFHSNTGAQHSISVSFSDHQFPDEEPLAEDFGNQDVTSVLSLEDASRLSGDWYNLLGQKMTGHPMRRGVYIVNGRRVIIK